MKKHLLAVLFSVSALTVASARPASAGFWECITFRGCEGELTVENADDSDEGVIRHCLIDGESETGRLLGEWVNKNSGNGIPRFIFRNIDCDNRIQIFGQCHPTECDWGSALLTRHSSGWSSAVYETSWVKRVVWIKLSADKSSVSMVIENEYKDGRADSTWRHQFVSTR